MRRTTRRGVLAHSPSQVGNQIFDEVPARKRTAPGGLSFAAAMRRRNDYAKLHRQPPCAGPEHAQVRLCWVQPLQTSNQALVAKKDSASLPLSTMPVTLARAVRQRRQEVASMA